MAPALSLIASSVVASSLVALSWLAAPAAAQEKGAGETMPRAVLELFTSQGCAACPPADALLGELSEEEGIIALTMPTKIWDFLGWADTLASDTLTKRQMAYSVALDEGVFTPQMVVNGDASVVGSDREAIDAAIEATDDLIVLPIDLSVDKGVLSVAVGKAGGGADVRETTLWLAVISRVATVPVRRGENRGRELAYYNAVKELRPIGMWKGDPLRLDLPLTDLDKTPGAGCVVFAQEDTFKGPGKIIGAAHLGALFPARDVVATPVPPPR